MFSGYGYLYSKDSIVCLCHFLLKLHMHRSPFYLATAQSYQSFSQKYLMFSHVLLIYLKFPEQLSSRTPLDSCHSIYLTHSFAQRKILLCLYYVCAKSKMFFETFQRRIQNLVKHLIIMLLQKQWLEVLSYYGKRLILDV